MELYKLSEKYKEFKVYYELGCELHKKPFNKNKIKIKRANHVIKVMKITDKIVQQLSWSEDEMKVAIIAACLHDIAKLSSSKEQKHNEEGAKWVKAHGEIFDKYKNKEEVQKAVKYAVLCHKGSFKKYIIKKSISHSNMQIIKVVRCADKISHIRKKGAQQVWDNIKRVCRTFDEIYEVRSLCEEENKHNKRSSRIIREIFKEENSYENFLKLYL